MSTGATIDHLNQENADLRKRIEVYEASQREVITMAERIEGELRAQLKSTEAALAQVVKERAEEKAAADRLRKRIAAALHRPAYQCDEQLEHFANDLWANYTTAQQDVGRTIANTKRIAAERDQAFAALQQIGELVDAPGGSSYFSIPEHVKAFKLAREKAAREVSTALGNLDARIQELTELNKEQVETIRELRERCAQDDAGVTIHECTPQGSSEMPCCGRSPLEVLAHRMTNDPRFVNCDRERLRERAEDAERDNARLAEANKDLVAEAEQLRKQHAGAETLDARTHKLVELNESRAATIRALREAMEHASDTLATARLASAPPDQLNPLGRAVVELARALGWRVIRAKRLDDPSAPEEVICRPARRPPADHFCAMAGCTDAVWAERALEMLLKDLAAPPAASNP